MHKVYKISLAAIITCFLSSMAMAQDTTGVTSVDVDLVNIFNQKTPKKYKIAAIKVTGNRFFDENLLVSISGLNIGDEVTIPGGDAFAKAINKLWGQNYFSDVQIYLTKLEAKNLSIEINVTERPRLSKFEFIGVKKGEKEDLMGKTGLVVNRIVTENMKRSAIEAITKYYAEKSYLNVKVSIDSKIDSSFGNTVALYFNVAKGNKVRINNIAFVGNTVDGLKLKKQLKETKEMSRLTLKRPDDKGKYSTGNVYTFNDYLLEKGYLTFSKTKRVLDPYVRLKLFASAKFNEKKFQEDKERLLEYYNALGYRDAAFDGKTAIDTNQQGNINIGIKINEGHKYYFGDIRWRGNTKYSDSTLTTILGIRKGDDYNLDILNKKLGKNLSPEGGDISGLYMDDGYLFFRTEPIETAVYNDTIDYEIRVVEGPQATWKNIKITGNEKTKEYVIRRELRTLPGEKFSRSDLIRSQRELGQLNYFNQEKINPNIVPNQEDGTVDVTWQLEEKSSDQLELSAGFGGGIGLTGTVGITFNNFSLKNIFKKTAWDPLPMGDGQKVSLRVQSNGRAFRSYNFSFTEPWLGGKKRNGFTFSLFDTKFANAYDPTTGTYTSEAANTSYIKTSGVSVNLAKQLKWPDDYFSLSLGLSYARYKLKNYYIDQVNLPGFNNGYSNNLSFKASLQRSSVGPNPLFPTSGSNFLMSLQITPPYSLLDKSIVNSSNPYTWVEYHKWRLNTEWYVPIGKPSGAEKNKQFILKAAAKFGYLGKYNPKLKISPFERFQVGDAGLSNQYALLGYDIIAQRGYPVYQNSDPKINPDQQGASEYFTIFNKYVLELRYPLSLNPSSTIYALGFFEAANGWFSAKEYNPFRLRRSVGVGMRFYLPMFGLLGFDYGIGLDRINGTNKLKDAARFTFMLGFEPE
ncbi:MAG: outer membrane protein assembly factor [Chitinophagaceae bacterium]|nr:outer membrane protein assembly factor [Chitinophagaceae bacterium]